MMVYLNSKCFIECCKFKGRPTEIDCQKQYLIVLQSKGQISLYDSDFEDSVVGVGVEDSGALLKMRCCRIASTVTIPISCFLNASATIDRCQFLGSNIAQIELIEKGKVDFIKNITKTTCKPLLEIDKISTKN